MNIDVARELLYSDNFERISNYYVQWIRRNNLVGDVPKESLDLIRSYFIKKTGLVATNLLTAIDTAHGKYVYRRLNMICECYENFPTWTEDLLKMYSSGVESLHYNVVEKFDLHTVLFEDISVSSIGDYNWHRHREDHLSISIRRRGGYIVRSLYISPGEKGIYKLAFGPSDNTQDTEIHKQVWDHLKRFHMLEGDIDWEWSP